ncbi:hypothetical protein AK812_SmicGene24472 [Symbiodinium microadriaticum]|uniref:EF-hand domain-containing protein n=1 Tax=Symbiodinium microadriaticum TaxID=2951 RepID=A0A1Q9DEF5_SYMMI|nr:hypothetical protein AK812_SmicGene24472 [Symbiodinium microadriaticum]
MPAQFETHASRIPFVLYITIITFAALRVITAVFLKDTLEAAQSDAEHQVAEKLKRKAQYATCIHLARAVEKLEVMFKAIDETGNGMITEERLNQLLSNPQHDWQLEKKRTVRAYLETLDLAVPEGTALFHILDNGDGEVTLEDLCQGLSDWERDRSGTQSIDTSQGRIDSRKNKVAEAGQVKLVQLYKTRSIQQAVWRCQTGQISQDVKTWGTLRHEHLRVFHLDQSMELDMGRSGRSGSSASDARYSIFSVDGICSLAEVLSRSARQVEANEAINSPPSAVDSLAYSLDASEVEDAFLTVFHFGYWAASSVVVLSCLSAQAPRATKRSRRSVKMLSFLALFGLTGLAAAGTIHQRTSKTLAAGSFLKPVEYEHTLRVCNAYPGTERFQVEMGGVSIMTGAPMGYKECQQLNLTKPLMPGDRLDFRADSLPVATFTVDSLPKYNAVMYVAVHRRGFTTDAVSFQSHMFSTAKNAQVAVLDTYTGEAKAALLLANSTGQWEGTVLPFGTAFGIPDGTYQVILSDGSADSKIRAPFTAVKGESYIVLRTGVTEKMANSSGIDYPQDLIVFPVTSAGLEDSFSTGFQLGPFPTVKLSGFEASHRTSTVQAALATDLPREAISYLERVGAAIAAMSLGATSCPQDERAASGTACQSVQACHPGRDRSFHHADGADADDQTRFASSAPVEAQAPLRTPSQIDRRAEMYRKTALSSFYARRVAGLAPSVWVDSDEESEDAAPLTHVVRTERPPVGGADTQPKHEKTGPTSSSPVGDAEMPEEAIAIVCKRIAMEYWHILNHACYLAAYFCEFDLHQS